MDSNNKTTAPKDWNKTLSDLFLEVEQGKKEKVSQTEIDWAIAYEQSVTPNDYRYPQKGDLYEVIIEQEIDYLTAWSIPFTGSGKATLFKGEQIWIDSKPNTDKPLSTYALAVNYSDLENRIVSETDRSNPDYSNFYFHIKTTVLNINFKLIATDFNLNNKPK